MLGELSCDTTSPALRTVHKGMIHVLKIRLQDFTFLAAPVLSCLLSGRLYEDARGMDREPIFRPSRLASGVSELLFSLSWQSSIFQF